MIKITYGEADFMSLFLGIGDFCFIHLNGCKVMYRTKEGTVESAKNKY